MRQGYIARAFHILIDVDDELRMEAINDIAIAAFRHYLQALKATGKK